MNLSGCKESQFYSLSFGQVVPSMASPIDTLTGPKRILTSRIDYS